MATELEINAKINTASSAEGLAGLRSSMKALISLQEQVGAGSAEFEKLREAINKTEGRIGDLNDSFATLRGSGTERLRASFGLLKEGFEGFDGGKISTAFKGIGSAMSAVPIFLVIEGVKVLIENFDKLVDFFKEATSASAGLKEELEALKKANEDIVIGIDNEITALSGLKSSEEEIIELKKQKLQLGLQEKKLALEVALVNQQAAQAELSTFDKLLQLSGNATSVEIKRRGEIVESQNAVKKATQELQAQLAAIQQLENEGTQKTLDNNKKKAQDYKKYLDDQQKLRIEANNAEAKAREDANLAIFNARKTVADTEKAQADIDKKAADQKRQEDADEEYEFLVEQEKKKAELAKENAKKIEDFKKTAVVQGLNASQALAQAFFAFQLRGAEGNAEREKEIRKKMFAVDKAFNVARATQDGIRSVQAALTIPPPFGQIAAGINATLAAANVAKILATKFDPGSSGGGGGSGTFSSGSGSAGSSLPPIQSPDNTSTLLNQPNASQPSTPTQKQGKLFVTQSDIKNSLNKVEVIETQATY